MTEAFTWKPLQEKTTNYFSFSSSIHLHGFVGIDLLEAPTPEMRKQLLVIGYNLIEAPTSKMCKQKLTIGHNLIEKKTTIMRRF